MFFSEYYGIDSSVVEHYGAVDISFVCDIPLFIDPMLIFNSEKEEYKKLHEEIIRYFHFLYQKACDGLSNKELKAWFEFNEVPNNWLGYSMSGNKGAALGKQYARFLYKNIRFATNTNNITKSNHIEKIMLLYEGSGKDKISDLTVNLIKGFLCSYTEEFARKYLDKKYIKKFHVEKAYFNYETESFVSKEYELPYITSEKGKKEYVLLTPKDILREDEPAINRKDFLDSYDDVRSMIDNDSLRTYVNNYIAKAILEYEDNQKRNKRSVNERSVKKIEKDAFKELAKEYPELYDYYIKYVENNPEQVSKLAHEECTEELEKFYSNSKILIAKVIDEGYVIQEDIEAREEAKNRLKFFKHIIEECDGYLALYYNGKQIAKEKDIQRLFRFVWYGTSYKVDAEPNNGRGQADFIVSKGMNNQNIIEFKLASNSSLGHVFTQIKTYEAANCTDGSLVVIFYFTEEEKRFAEKVIEDSGYKLAIDESIFLIDCRKDNKKSASIA